MKTKITKQLSVVVDRVKWLRGTGDGTLLRLRAKTPDENGCMCCLGFAARAAGMTKKEITNTGAISDCARTPRSLLGLFMEHRKGLSERHTVQDDLITANDSRVLTGAQRERRIKSLGKKAGILFSFVGRTPRKV